MVPRGHPSSCSGRGHREMRGEALGARLEPGARCLLPSLLHGANKGQGQPGCRAAFGGNNLLLRVSSTSFPSESLLLAPIAPQPLHTARPLMGPLTALSLLQAAKELLELSRSQTPADVVGPIPASCWASQSPWQCHAHGMWPSAPFKVPARVLVVLSILQSVPAPGKTTVHGGTMLSPSCW